MRARAIVLLAAAAACVGAQGAGGQANVDEFKRQYSPIECGMVGECACPQAGTPRCRKCRLDKDSEWKDKKVCICTQLDTASKIECSAGRKFSPVKLTIDDLPPAPVAPNSAGALPGPRPPPGRPKRLNLGAAVGIGLGALALFAVACLGGWVLLGRRKRKRNGNKGNKDDGSGHMGMGSGSGASGGTGNAGIVGDSAGVSYSACMGNSSSAEAAYIDFSSSGEHQPSPPLHHPPTTPSYMQKDFVNITPPPVGDGTSALTDSADVLHGAFLSADTPPPADISWGGDKVGGDASREVGRDFLATSAGTGASAGTDGTAPTPPRSWQGAHGGRESLATSAETGASGGTDGTGSTPPPAWQAATGGRDILATTVDSGGTGGTGPTPPPERSGFRGGETDILATTVDLETHGLGGASGSTLTD